MRIYEPGAGLHIQKAAEEMVDMFWGNDEPVKMSFNDVEIVAVAGDTAEGIVSKYHAECERRAEEYRASPAGQEAERRAAEARKEAATAEAEGILPFAIRDPDAWDKCVKDNSDPYGSCAVRFAARWANLMEQKIAEGAILEAIADDSSHEANKEGITGFMYGCAVSILSQVWVHGEQLRRWHNLKTQFRDEGEKANETGGVLNPALLTIG
jgi:hypothetical protein